MVNVADSSLSKNQNMHTQFGIHVYKTKWFLHDRFLHRTFNLKSITVVSLSDCSNKMDGLTIVLDQDAMDDSNYQVDHLQDEVNLQSLCFPCI